MEINNHHISQIQSLLHDELSPTERTKLLSDIENNQALKQEYLLQKELHKAFEEMGKQELKKYLSKNHNRFKRFVFFKKYFLIISVILFTAAISYFGYHFIKKTQHTKHIKTTTTTSKSDIKKKIPSSIQEKEETTIQVTSKKITNVLEKTNETNFSTQKIQKKITSAKEKTDKNEIIVLNEKHEIAYIEKPIIFKELSPIDSSKIFIKKGKIHFEKISNNELKNIKLIQLKGYFFLQWKELTYQLAENNTKLIRDTRIIEKLKFIKKTNKQFPIKIKNYIVENTTHKTYTLEINEQHTPNVKNDTITLEHFTSLDSIHVIRLENKDYIFVNDHLTDTLFNSKMSLYLDQINFQKTIPIYTHEPSLMNYSDGY